MVYDLIIVGGGPSGLTAGIYACRSKLKTLLIEKMIVGGAVNYTYEIKNFPSYETITGPQFVENMFKQAQSLGLEIVYDEVLSYDFSDKIKKIICESGTFLTKSVILCNGASNKKLGLDREIALTGQGVSYCAVCDGAFFKDKEVAICGGGNTAMEDAIYLSALAKTVYVIVRKDQLVADQTLIDNAYQKNNVKFIFNSNIIKLNGDKFLQGLVIENNQDLTKKELNVNGLFIAIGRQPETEKLKNIIDLDSNGYILTDEDMQTNIKGVYAAGDVRSKSLRQIITACSDGATASTKANQFLRKNKEL